MDNKLEITKNELDQRTLDIAEQLVAENDMSKVKDLTQLFNAAHMKKQVLRAITYNNLLDHITNQIQDRIIQRGDQFSNKDLLDYANSVTTSLEKAQKQISGIDDMPIIQFNQQNNTVVVDTLDGESQQRVENVVKAILKKIKEKPINNEIIENSSVQDDNDDSLELKEELNNIDNNIIFNEEGED